MDGHSFNLVVEAGLGFSGSVAGAILAGRAAPTDCHWKSFSTSVLRQWLTLMVKAVPSHGRRIAGMGVIALLLAGGGLVAYVSAAPASAQFPMQNLAAAVIAVTGSGGQIALQIDTGDGPRTLYLGDEFARGWVLTALTPSLATFTRDDEVREIPISPRSFTVVTGGGSSARDGDFPAADPLQVTQAAGAGAASDLPDEGADPARFDQEVCRGDPVLTADDCAGLVQEVASGRWDGRAHWGLSLADTTRLEGLDHRRLAYYTIWFAGHFVPEAPFTALVQPGLAQQVGNAYGVYLVLAKQREAYSQAHSEAELARRPVGGGSSIYVPVGRMPNQVMTEQGIDPRGVWSFQGEMDAQGGRWDERIGPADFFDPLAFRNAVVNG